MRRLSIFGNWKMNTTRDEAVALAKGIAAEAGDVVDVGVCPPFVYLATVADALAGSPVRLGAQDVYHKTVGAFTGEVSPAMLLDVGCTYAIIGHSERRGRFGKPDESLSADAARVFGDTDASVNLKVKAALKHDLVPIVCVGEILPEREDGRTDEIVDGQLRAGLAGFTAEEVAGIVIAYEPVWAIGTGRACDAAEANRVCGLIRSVIGRMFADETAAALRVQYGGSVSPDNAHELISQPEIDGGLVGGASLDACKFSQIVTAASVIAKQMRYS